jgi:hypothetical protein
LQLLGFSGNEHCNKLSNYVIIYTSIIDEICPSLNNNMQLQEVQDKEKELEIVEHIYYLVDCLEELKTEYKTNNKVR